MANRYWVNGGSGLWNNTNNWSATSGGASGASVPSTADDVFFDGAGNSNCTVNTSATVLSIRFASSYTATLNIPNAGFLYAGVYIEFASNTIINYTGTGAGFIGVGNGLSVSVRTNGCVLQKFKFDFAVETTAPTVTLLDTLNVSGEVNFFTPSNANLNIQGFSIEATGNLVQAGFVANRIVQGTTLLNIVGSNNQTLNFANSRAGLTTTINKSGGVLTIQTMTMQGSLTHISGVVNHTGTLIIQGNTTLNTSGINWLNVSFTNFVPSTVTLTLLSNFNVTGNVNCGATNGILNIVNSGGSWTSIGGVLSNSIAFTLNLANPITCNGLTSSIQQFTINNHSISNTGNLTVGQIIVGTTTIIMAGTGTWSGASLINMDMDINTGGTITLSGASVIFGQQGSGVNPRFNYITGTINQGSTIFRMEEGRYDMSGVTWSNLITGTSGTIVTLLADINCVNFTPTAACTLNGAFNFNINGDFSPPQTVSGTSTIRMVGTGTWLGGGAVNCNLVFNTAGTITIGSIVNFGASSGVATMTYTTGTVVTTGSTLTLRTSFVNTGIIQWNNVTIVTSPTITLLSNLLVYGLLTINNANTTLNTSNSSKICCFEGFTLGNINILGTSSIELVGNGTLTGTQTSGVFQIPLIINTNGVVNLVGSLSFSGTFIHVKGTFISKGSQVILRTGATVLGASRMNLDNVQITGGGTITMDEFFSGTPQIPTKVVSSTTANYTINFTDGFEKLAKNVRVSRCTIANRGQLLLLSKGGFGVNNLGIRYYNQLPNGVSTDTQKFVNNNLAGMPPLRTVNMLVGDPVFT